jgi:hypothetical protein
MRPKKPKLTDAEIQDMIDEDLPRCLYVEMRQLEERLAKMTFAERADYADAVWQDMIESGALVEYPEGSGRYILKFWLDTLHIPNIKIWKPSGIGDLPDK